MHVADQQHVIYNTASGKIARVLYRIASLKRVGRWVYYRWDNSRLGHFVR